MNYSSSPTIPWFLVQQPPPIFSSLLQFYTAPTHKFHTTWWDNFPEIKPDCIIALPKIHQWLPQLWGQRLDILIMLSHPFTQGSPLSISWASSLPGLPHANTASCSLPKVMPVSWTQLAPSSSAPFCMLDLSSLPPLPYSPTCSWLTSTYSSGFSLLQKAFSVPTKLGQVALYMLLQHFVPGSLMILHCIVYWSATYFPRSPLNSKLHEGRDHFCLTQCLAEVNN